MNWWQTQLSCIYHVNAHDEHFLVCILRTYCCRLIQPVKMYMNWYMMWYLKKDMLCKEHIFEWFVIFKTVCPSSVFFVSLAVVRHPADTFHVECVCASALILYARENLRSCARSYLAISCTIIRTIFLVGPGFEPLALHAIFFVGPGFDSLTLQHDLFVGPGFDSRTRSPVFRPIVSVAYVTRPHD